MVEEVWKQWTLLQLLQTVELPVLDCILATPTRGAQPQPQAAALQLLQSHHQDLVISNTFLDRELPQTLNLPELVPNQPPYDFMEKILGIVSIILLVKTRDWNRIMEQNTEKVI